MKVELIVCSVLAMVYISGCEKFGIWVPVKSPPAGGQQTAGMADPNAVKVQAVKEGHKAMDEKVIKSDAEWKRELEPMSYEVLRKRVTEQAYTGKYWNSKEIGTYRCAGCGAVLFESATKFDSGCGWPSFFSPADNKRIEERVDRSHGMVRTEVVCARCGGHLGHVFNDGPNPTGLRYCINSASLKFEAATK
jgi:peptide-methionine (R)-S-oxide reductase